MNWEDFLQFEEDRENKRRQERMAREQAEEAKKKTTGKIKVVDKRAEQRALRERIMNEARDRYVAGNKKKYDLAQPPNGPVPWLVFERATGVLLGEATAWRAHRAWESLNLPQPFPACRCVQRSDWEAAEAAFRKKRSNGHVG